MSGLQSLNSLVRSAISAINSFSENPNGLNVNCLLFTTVTRVTNTASFVLSLAQQLLADPNRPRADVFDSIWPLLLALNNFLSTFDQLHQYDQCAHGVPCGLRVQLIQIVDGFRSL